MQPIISVPHQILRATSIRIDKITPDVQSKVLDLIDTMKNAHNPEGVGLSFPQIGHSLRGFVTYLDKKIKVYLNPVILDISDDLTYGGTKDRPTLEGCLSIPWLYGPVPRPKKIKIQAIDEHGVEFVKILSSFPARLAMHEYDHLEGILFTDYTLSAGLPLYHLNHDSDQFVKIEDPSSVIKW